MRKAVTNQIENNSDSLFFHMICKLIKIAMIFGSCKKNSIVRKESVKLKKYTTFLRQKSTSFWGKKNDFKAKSTTVKQKYDLKAESTIFLRRTTFSCTNVHLRQNLRLREKPPLSRAKSAFLKQKAPLSSFKSD